MFISNPLCPIAVLKYCACVIWSTNREKHQNGAIFTFLNNNKKSTLEELIFLIEYFNFFSIFSKTFSWSEELILFFFYLNNAAKGIIEKFLFSTEWLWLLPVILISNGLVKLVIPRAPQPCLFFFIQCLSQWEREWKIRKLLQYINTFGKKNSPIYCFSECFLLDVIMSIV